VLRIDKFATEVIGPLVVRADQPANRSLGFVDQTGTAMTANVQERANFAIIVAQQQDRGRAHVDHAHIARFGNFRTGPHDNPVPMEEDVEIGGEHCRRIIERRGQRPPGAIARKHLGDGRRVIDSHGTSRNRRSTASRGTIGKWRWNGHIATGQIFPLV
jgi:hypothetical protein